MRRLLAALAALAITWPAAAQYPEKPLTMLAGYPPGGLVDVVARLVAEGMKPKFPRGLNVVNRPGAAGSVAVAELARSAPDGHTIILTPDSALCIAAQMQELSYKTPDDYDPIINLIAYYPMIAVRTESEYKTIQELIADAKANPGKIRVGSPGEGTSSHLNLEDLMAKTGAKMIHVPFQGWAQSSPALLGGHIEAAVAQPGELKGPVDGKRMRVLVNFRPERLKSFPDVPTAKELGWDVSYGVWFMLLAPSGTPAPVVLYLHGSAKATIDDFKKAFTKEDDLGSYTFPAYDCAKILIEAIGRAIDDAGGKMPTREQVRAQVAKTKDYKGATGTYTFDADGDVTAPTMAFWQMKGTPAKWVFSSQFLNYQPK